MRKLLVLTILLAAVGVVGVKYFTTSAEDRARRSGVATSVSVETALVKLADLGDHTVFTGSIRAEERYDAAPKIPGLIRQINFNVGDVVTRGAILAILDDDEHSLAVEQAEAKVMVARATVNDAKAQLEIARRDYDRAENLHRERVMSAQDFDQTAALFRTREANVETAVANERLAEAELKTRQVILGYTRVRADWDGDGDQRVIGQRYMDAGAMVAANTPILSVLDIDTVRALISVSEKEYPRIAMDDPVTVTTDAFPGRQFPGRVARIPQELGLFTREAEVEVAVANSDRVLKPGMFVRAAIEFQRRTGAAAAPLEAVVRRDDGRRGVYLVDESRTTVSFEPITEGIRDGSLVELVDGGALIGREVVTLGQHLLKDGMAIRVADAKAMAVPGRASPEVPGAGIANEQAAGGA
jgi:RND family efflux transporter MFP subunit